DTDADTDTDTGETGDTGEPPAPRYVVLFVGDGMGFEHVRGGGWFANGAEGSLVMEALPYAGRLRTASLTGTTDSAAGATALATGNKTWNDYVGVDRDEAELETLLERARALGLSAGVVTTDELTGATPSSFFAHTPDRTDAAEIAAQLCADLPDLTLGGGGDDLADCLASGPSAQIVEDETALLAAVPDGRPLLGVFADDQFDYVADGYDPGVPTLATMTTVALEWLDDDPEGFFLVVEGARIDHASHSNGVDEVHAETAALDEAVAAAVAWASTRGDVTLLVTADHECGGMRVTGGSSAGVAPDTEWRWGQHTNADVPVFGTGTLAATFDGQRLDNTWVHAVLDAAIAGEPSVTPPADFLVADGYTDDLGSPVTTQTWTTSFGSGYNQLDALRVTTDATGIWVGVDGVFEYGENTALLLVDLDYGDGTGLTGDVSALADTNGTLDQALSAVDLGSGVAGLGWDVAVGSVEGEEIMYDDLAEYAGLRGLHGDWGATDDLWWLDAVTAFDDGNLARYGLAADDAGATGTTEGGWEIWIPWDSVYPSGLPAGGTDVALVALLVNTDGSWASNQALPPLATSDEPGEDTVTVEQVVAVGVDAGGLVTSGPSLAP
ncbi:MAG: alkaline phosphatase, partial [Myxococcota bacterium]